MRKVLPGEQFSIRSDDWNAIADVVRDYRQSLLDGGARAAPLGGGTEIVLAKNDSGGDLGQFSVVVVTGVAVGPGDNLNEYLYRPVFLVEVMGGGE